MSRLLRSGPRRVVGPAPARLVVEGVAQRTEGLLPAGRRDVEALARLQVAPGGQDVHMHAAAALAVLDRRPRVAVRFEPRPRGLLELVEHGLDLRVSRPVRRPRDRRWLTESGPHRSAGLEPLHRTRRGRPEHIRPEQSQRPAQSQQSTRSERPGQTTTPEPQVGNPVAT